ncbi:uncharacterized protein RHO17_011736 [Thomomys bottae]
MEDSHLCRPSWTSNTGKYLNTICPQTVEEGASTEPSTGAPVFDTEDGNLRIPSWITDVGKYQTTICSRVVEDGAPRHSSPGAHVSTKEGNLYRAPLMISDSGLPTTECPQIFEEVASKKTPPGILISALKKRDVHRAISKTNNRIMNFKHEILQGQAIFLQATMSKLPTEDITPHRITSTNKKRGHVSMSPQRSIRTPGLSALEVNPSVEGQTIRLQSAREKSAIEEIKSHRAAWTINNIQKTFSSPSIEGKAIGKPTAGECPAAGEIKPGKGKVSPKVTKNVQFDLNPSTAEVTKTVRFNLSPPKAVESLAGRGKSTTEDTKLLHAMLNTNKGYKAKSDPFMDNYVEFKAKFNSTADKWKQYRTTLTPVPWTTQILEGQSVKLSNNPLIKKTASSQRMEGKMVGATTTKANSLTDKATLGRYSAKITKGVKFELSPQRAEDPATKHGAPEDNLEAKAFILGKDISAANIAHKISDLQRAEGGSTGPQTATGILAVEDLNQDRANLLRRIIQENESTPLAEATAKIQASRSNSTEGDTKMDKVVSSTKITNTVVNPGKGADQAHGILTARTNPSPEIKLRRPSMILNNVYLTVNPPGTGLLTARGNLKTKEARSHKNASSTRLVHQTLHFGPVRLLPARANPTEHRLQRAETIRAYTVCDLEIQGANLSCFRSRLKKTQAFTGFECSECECPTPNTSPNVLLVTSDEQHMCPGEHGDSQDMLHHRLGSSPQSANMSDKSTCSQLTDNFQTITAEAPKTIGIQKKEIPVCQESLQQDRKQLGEETLFVKGPNTFSLKQSATSNEPPEEVLQDHGEIEQKEQESPTRCVEPTTDLKERHLEVCKGLQLEETSQLPTATHTFQLDEVMETHDQASQDENTHNDNTPMEGNTQSQLLPQREFLPQTVSDIGALQLRDQMRRHKKKTQLGTLRKVCYDGVGNNMDKEKQPKNIQKLIFLPRS